MAQASIRHIEIVNNRDGQPRAYVQGTRIRVANIYVLSQMQGHSPDDIVAAYPHLTLGQIHAALSYCFDNIDSIQEELRQDEEFVTRLRSQTGPGPLEQRLGDMNAPGDSVSS